MRSLLWFVSQSICSARHHPKHAVKECGEVSNVRVLDNLSLSLSFSISRATIDFLVRPFVLVLWIRHLIT